MTRNSSNRELYFPIRLRCATVNDILTNPELEDTLARALGRAFAHAQTALPKTTALGDSVALHPPYLSKGELTSDEAKTLLALISRAIERVVRKQRIFLSTSQLQSPHKQPEVLAGSTAVQGLELVEERVPLPGRSKRLTEAETLEFTQAQYDRVDWQQPASTYSKASLSAAGSPLAEVTAESPRPTKDEFHDYVFIFAGGSYGESAIAFMKAFYPKHVLFRVGSFEEMFHKLLGDIRKRAQEARSSGRRLRIREIVIISHARLTLDQSAGALVIPLMRGEGKITTPEDIADLQQDFRQNLKNKRLQAFRSERSEVVEALDEQTRIVVRACRFGQVSEALGVLRVFFGGRPTVFATTGYQGFEIRPKSILKNPEEAYDFLIRAGYLPPFAADIEVADKKRYIEQVLMTKPEVKALIQKFGGFPAEFFLMSEQAHEEYQKLEKKNKKLLLGPKAEIWKLRLSDVYAELPDEKLWEVSADPKLDALSADELVARARSLRNPYRPQHAAMLLRLQAAWERKTRVMLGTHQWISTTDDPLDPSSIIFGNPIVLARDAARSSEKASDIEAAQPFEKAPDIFEKETLTVRNLTPQQRVELEQPSRAEHTLEAGAAPQEPREQDYPAQGRIYRLPDGLRLWNFAVGSSQLRPEFHTPLKQFAQMVGSNPKGMVSIDGHTSSSGSEELNERLSLERSEAVRQFLISAGVSMSQIEAKGYGRAFPLACERRSGGQLIPGNMARNRRVVIHFLAQAAIQPTQKPGKADVDEIIRLFGPPPANLPGWLQWVNKILHWAELGHVTVESTIVLAGIEGVVELIVQAIGTVLASITVILAIGQTYYIADKLAYENGRKDGYVWGLVQMAKQAKFPPTGKITKPPAEESEERKERKLGQEETIWGRLAAQGYRDGIQDAIRFFEKYQKEAPPHGGEIILRALVEHYGEGEINLYKKIMNMLGGIRLDIRSH